MASVASILHGFDYQSAVFWREAVRLFRRNGDVERVALELRLVRAFDDVLTYHRAPETSVFNEPVDIDCFQAKFKVDNRSKVSIASLSDPDFLNAKSVSLLQRAANAHRHFANDGLRGRFNLITPWQLDEDGIGRLIDSNGGFRLRLLEDGGPRSDRWKIRAAWREHLGFSNDDELFALLRTIRIHSKPLDHILEIVDAGIDAVRLRPRGAADSYLRLARQFIDLDDRIFDADRLRQACAEAELWLTDPQDSLAPRQLGIRSRSPFAARLEDETDRLLDLVPLFHDRDLRDEVGWDADIYPRISEFLQANVESGRSYNLHLDAHASIAFAAGYVLAKAGADVAPVQASGPRRTVWHPSGAAASADWHEQIVDLDSGGADLAIGIGMTHDVTADLMMYVTNQLPAVNQVRIFLSEAGPSRNSVRDADHAVALATDLSFRLRAVPRKSSRTIHLFAAAPNALLYFAGRESHGLGRITSYEFDFERGEPGAYTPGITVPQTKE